MRPNYMVIGSAKCGTTSLAALLGRHPDVFMTNPKEPNFFCWDNVYARGFDWYESLYEGTENTHARGEASVYCSVRHLCPHAAERIAEYEPAMKLIYIVRPPLEKLESTWVQWRSISVERAAELGRELDLGTEPLEVIKHGFSDTIRRDELGVIRTANYWREINVFRQLFSDDQILVLFLEDLKAQRRAVLRRCFEFLGVDPEAEIPSAQDHLNRAVDKTVPRPGFSRLRALPGVRSIYRRASAIVPDRARYAISDRLLRVPVTEKPQWDEGLRHMVLEQLRGDLETFLDFYRKPPNFWNLRD